MIETSSASVCEAVSSVLNMLEEKRKLSYTLSGIQLVTEMDNKYPLSDVIMRSYKGTKNFKGILEGHGTVEFKDGHSYEGEFHQGVMHGQGRYVWKDRLVYEGEFRDCKITGIGKYTWPDGSTYTGEVENGLRHGQGTYWCAITGSTYVGQWVLGRREGHGRLNYSSPGGEGAESAYYDGEWVDNQQEGFGTRRYRSGNVYEGEWHNNERHGKGTMHWYDRGERYTGQWVKGVQHGQGEHTWIIHGLDNAQYPLCNCYFGNWNQGKREGFGTFYYANGSKYIGEWHQDLKHGKGKFVFQSGQVFEGEFRKDKMAGGRGSNHKPGLLRPQTPLGSLIGDIDHSDIITGGSITEKFNLEISKLLPETNIQHELRQIHCVLMRHISQLKNIYHHYSSLGSGPVDFINKGCVHCCTLTQMQLWRLLMDCKIHHQGITLHSVDHFIHPDAPPSLVHDPNNTFLMREFLQVLVFLSHHLISSQQESRTGELSQKLSLFITTHLLPHACDTGGTLYCQPPACIAQALKYQQEVWQLYQEIQSNSSGVVRLRDILWLLKDHGLVSSSYPASSIVRVLVKDNPLAVDGEDYNLEVKRAQDYSEHSQVNTVLVFIAIASLSPGHSRLFYAHLKYWVEPEDEAVVFLEFFEILIQCAQEWYKSCPVKISEPPVVKHELSVPILLITSDIEVKDNSKVPSSEFEGNISPVQNVLSTDGGSSKQESEIQLSDNHQILRQQGHQGELIVERPDLEGSGAEDVVTQLFGGVPQVVAKEKPQEEDEKQASKESVPEAEHWSRWKEMLQAFFGEHLLSSTYS